MDQRPFKKLEAVFEYVFYYSAVWGYQKLRNQKCIKNEIYIWRFGPFGGHQRLFKKLEAVFENVFYYTAVWGIKRCEIKNV